MRRIFLVLIPLVLIAVLPRASLAREASSSSPALLSAGDRAIATRISRTAMVNPIRAVSVARHQRQIVSALLGPDHRTVELRFLDGARADLLPRTVVGSHSSSLPLRTLLMTHQAAPQNGQPRAVVLEPFATELGDGPTAGQSEADMLTRAGFHVDIYRDQQVTISLLLTLSQYSLVYMKTHAGVLPGGDAVIAAGDTATAPYIKIFGRSAYYDDQHPNAPTVLGQVFVDGGDGGLFNAIRAKFVTDYLGAFPDSSMFFLNGCDILQAPMFLDALQMKNLASIVTWDQEVRADAAERGLDYTLNQMVSGDTLNQAITAAIADGVGTAYTANGPAHLRYVGAGDIKLADVLDQATPTPTATPNASATPVPTSAPPTDTPTPLPTKAPLFLRVKVQHSRVKAGQVQKVSVTTIARAFVKIVLQFPNKTKKTHTGHASGAGTLTWSFKQPKVKLTGHNHTVKVKITVGGGKSTKSSAKSYTLG